MGEYGADRAIYIDLRTKDDERTMMAQDYDSPRNKDEDEESLQALGKSSQNARATSTTMRTPSPKTTNCRAPI